MLAVKTASSIVHEKIRLSDSGTYDLVSSSSQDQPVFPGIPSLVEWYSVQRDGIRFTLTLDNPLYDNNNLRSNANNGNVAPNSLTQYLQIGDEVENDPYAPSLPLKNREIETVAALALDNGEMYTNAADAKNAIRAQSFS